MWARLVKRLSLEKGAVPLVGGMEEGAKSGRQLEEWRMGMVKGSGGFPSAARSGEYGQLSPVWGWFAVTAVTIGRHDNRVPPQGTPTGQIIVLFSCHNSL